MAFPVIRTSDGFTTVVDGKAYTVNKSNANFNRLLKYVREGNSTEFFKFLNPVNNEVTIKSDGIYLDGKRLNDVLGTRVQQMIAEGFDVQPMRKFLVNLLKNPSEDSKKELYAFMEKNHLPITEDGYFLAYKVVQNDWYSKTAGTLVLKSGYVSNGKIFNGISKVIECSRDKVDADRRKECSYGLHVGSLSYSGPGGQFYQSGDRVVIVKVNPADVISVPEGYNCSKMRVCKYVVLSEYKLELNKSVYTNDGNNASSRIEQIDVLDVVEGDYITFTYVKSNGSVSDRDILVSEIHKDRLIGYSNYLEGNLYDEEPELKTFIFSRMSNVKVK